MLFMKSLLIIEKSWNQNSEPLNRNNHPHLLSVSFSPTRLMAGRTIKNWTSRKNVLGVARCVLRLLSCCHSSFWRTSFSSCRAGFAYWKRHNHSVFWCNALCQISRLCTLGRARAGVRLQLQDDGKKSTEGALAVWIGLLLSAGTGRCERSINNQESNFDPMANIWAFSAPMGNPTEGTELR